MLVPWTVPVGETSFYPTWKVEIIRCSFLMAVFHLQNHSQQRTQWSKCLSPFRGATAYLFWASLHCYSSCDSIALLHTHNLVSGI